MRCRQALVQAQFLLEYGQPAHAMVYAMLAVLRFVPWVDIDSVRFAIHDMTDHGTGGAQ